MDVGEKVPETLSDHIGSILEIQTPDGLVHGRLDNYCRQLGQLSLSFCLLDGEFVGDVIVYEREVIPDQETGSKFTIVKKNRSQKVPVVFRGLPELEKLSISKSHVKSDTDVRTGSVSTGEISSDETSTDESGVSLTDPSLDNSNDGSSNLSMDEMSAEARREALEEYEKSKDFVKQRFLRKRFDGEEKDPTAQVRDWSDEIPFDADDIRPIYSAAESVCFEAVETIRQNDRIGIALFGTEVNRFHPIDCLAVSCSSLDQQVIIYVFYLKDRVTGEVNGRLAKVVKDILSNKDQVKVMHDCSSLSDMVKARLSIEWTSDEVEDTMCHDIELRRVKYERDVWQDSRNKFRPRPSAEPHVEFLLHNYMGLDFTCEFFPNFMHDDEWRCLFAPTGPNNLTIEAKNFLKRKTLFLCSLIETICQKAEDDGLIMDRNRLDDLTQTRLEVKRDADPGKIEQIQMEEKYRVPQITMYFNPHASMRQFRENQEKIVTAVGSSPKEEPIVTDAKSDRLWMDGNIFRPPKPDEYVWGELKEVKESAAPAGHHTHLNKYRGEALRPFQPYH